MWGAQVRQTLLIAAAKEAEAAASAQAAYSCPSRSATVKLEVGLALACCISFICYDKIERAVFCLADFSSAFNWAFSLKACFASQKAQQ